MESYIKENKNDYTALYNYGYMAEQFNHIEKAINCYQTVSKKNKNNWRSRFNLYLIYFHKQRFYLTFLEIKQYHLTLQSGIFS